MEGLDLLTKGLLFEDVKQFNKKINLDELPKLNITNTNINTNTSTSTSTNPSTKSNNKDVYRILDFLNIEIFENYNDWL